MPSPKIKLVIATHNRGKIKELNNLLINSNIGIQLLSLSDFSDVVEVSETGLTFQDNARLKATGYALQTGVAALADDSGLEVAALDNRPGVYSARYAGPNSNFSEKMDKLLGELSQTGGLDRRARFVCSMAVADSNGKILAAAEGICNGRIASLPTGTGGFGYDPIFIPDGYRQTFGELSGEIKQSISHRFRAFDQIIPFLRHFNAH